MNKLLYSKNVFTYALSSIIINNGIIYLHNKLGMLNILNRNKIKRSTE